MGNRFSETQRFRQVWLWALVLCGVAVGAGVMVYSILHEGIIWDNEMYFGLAVSIIVPALVVWLLWSMKLETLVDAEGIRFKLWPIHRRMQVIDWGAVHEIYVRQYKPIREYGGWGMRSGGFRKGDAFNISGNKGLQIIFKSGKKLLLGTQRPGELQALLDQLASKGMLNTTSEHYNKFASTDRV